MKRITSVALLLAASLSGSPLAADAAVASAPSHPSRAQHSNHASRSLAPLTDREKAQQILNRFTFGPRPGEVDAVMRMGWQQWFAQQLQPNSIPDPALDKRLAEFPALNLRPAQLLEQFPSNGRIRQISEGKRPYSADPMTAGLEQVLVLKFEERATARAEKADAANDTHTQVSQTVTNTVPSALAAAGPANPSPASQSASPAERSARPTELANQLLARPRNERMQAVLALPVEDRRVLAEKVADPQKSQLLKDFNSHEREIFRAMGGGPDAVAIVDNELQQAKVLRAILSERQLQEVMTDFWFNHFNVYIHKDADHWYTPSYERDTIRPHALGKFSDLLLATAQDPAMLYFLDNWSSIGPDSAAASRPRGKNNDEPRGLNENYGREVMELHTVGVNGGYSQADVTTLAKILTGWTIDRPQEGGGFVYEPRRHEPGAQQWFGRQVPDSGYQAGREALLWLAAQPQTAHFVSYKIAQRFVADDPPPALVDAMAETYLRTDGDIRELLLTMVHSPEFWSRGNYRNKVKTPLEYVASAMRATGADPSNPGALVATIGRMGEPLYQMQPPTGYPMTASSWMNTGALVERLNFSLQLADGHLGGMKFDAAQLLANSLLSRPAAAHTGPGTMRVSLIPAQGGAVSGQAEAVTLMEQALLGSRASAQTEAVIEHQLESAPSASASSAPETPSQQLTSITALLLGSPEFQMR